MDKSMFSGAVPILASLNIGRTIQFYCAVLGFTKIHEEPEVYGIVGRDAVAIHFWACLERHITENTACRIEVKLLLRQVVFLPQLRALIMAPSSSMDEPILSM
jgi:hypothetical protein